VAKFSIGEEVLFEEERFVISEISLADPKRYRLLATTPKGTRVEWVTEKNVQKMAHYTTAYDDTALY
jgi:hypothetical protein